MQRSGNGTRRHDPVLVSTTRCAKQTSSGWWHSFGYPALLLYRAVALQGCIEALRELLAFFVLLCFEQEEATI